MVWMWQMPCNICRSAKDRSNPNHVNSMSGCDIVEERDLGVLIDNHLNSHGHSSTAIGKVRRLL